MKIFKPGYLPVCCTEAFASKPRVIGCTFTESTPGYLACAFCGFVMCGSFAVVLAASKDFFVRYNKRKFNKPCKSRCEEGG